MNKFGCSKFTPNLQRPSYINISNSPTPISMEFNAGVIKELSKDFDLLQRQSDPEDITGEKILTFLRIRPAKSIGTFEIRNENELLVKCPVKIQRNNSDKYGNEVVFSFNKILGPESTQMQVFDECVLSALERVLHGDNCLVFAYGATNSGKTHTLQGYGNEFGVVPRSLDFLFNRLEDSLYNGCNIRPSLFNQFESLSEKEIELVLETKSRVLTEVKKHSEIDKYAASFRNSLCGSENSISHRPCVDILSTPVAQASLLEETTVHSIWISFAEIYNERVYDVFDPISKKPRELKVQNDKNNFVFIRDLTEVFVTSAEEAYKLFLAGKKNLRYAATDMNHNSSRSHCLFTVTIVTLGKINGNIYPKNINRLTFCDLAGAERAAQTGNVGPRLVESSNINQSLMALLRCIRVMRDNQSKKSSTLEHVPFRTSKLARIFKTHMVSASHIRMIVNINSDPRNHESTMQVLYNSAVASQVTTFKKVERPVNNSSFYKRVRESITIAETAKMSLVPVVPTDTIAIKKEEKPYECPTVVAKPKIVRLNVPTTEYTQESSKGLEAEVSRLRDALDDKEDEVLRLRKLIAILEEPDSENTNKENFNEETVTLWNEEQIKLYAHAMEEKHKKEIESLKRRFAKGLVLSDDYETCSSSDEEVGNDHVQNKTDRPALMTLPRALMEQNKKVDELAEANAELLEGINALQKDIEEKKAEIVAMRFQLTAKEDLFSQVIDNHKTLLKLKDEEISALSNGNVSKQNEESMVHLSSLMKEVERLQKDNEEQRGELLDGQTTCLEYDEKLAEANRTIAELNVALNSQIAETRKCNEELCLLHETYELLTRKLEKADKITERATIGTVTTPTLNRSVVHCTKRVGKRKGPGPSKAASSSKMSSNKWRENPLQSQNENDLSMFEN